jgi:hypothetical protein
MGKVFLDMTEDEIQVKGLSNAGEESSHISIQATQYPLVDILDLILRRMQYYLSAMVILKEAGLLSEFPHSGLLMLVLAVTSVRLPDPQRSMIRL